MVNALYEINKATKSSHKNIQIMTVFEVVNGEATLLITDEDVELKNEFTHSSSVPVLSVGDKVIVQIISNHFILTDKLRNFDEKPSIGFEVNEDGSLSLYSDVSIHLTTLNAKIDVLSNGKILIDGNEVYSISNGINRIQGSSIELN